MGRWTALSDYDYAEEIGDPVGRGGSSRPRPQSGQPLLKPESSKTSKHREKRLHSDHVSQVRQYVFARERNIDRVTRNLPAESMHELLPRSLGGKVSRRNSIAVQGDGVQGIHGLLQRREISYEFETPEIGAEGTIVFTAHTRAAAEAMKVKVGESIVSPPMAVVEETV